MCMDFLDPCKICRFMCYVVLVMVLVFIGGYLGKGIYLHANKDNTGDVMLHDVLIDPNFWVPDGYFWVFGIAFVVLLFVATAIMRGLFMGLYWLLKYLVRRLCCRGESNSDLEDGKQKGQYDRLEAEDKTKEG